MSYPHQYWPPPPGADPHAGMAPPLHGHFPAPPVAPGYASGLPSYSYSHGQPNAPAYYPVASIVPAIPAGVAMAPVDQMLDNIQHALQHLRSAGPAVLGLLQQYRAHQSHTNPGNKGKATPVGMTKEDVQGMIASIREGHQQVQDLLKKLQGPSGAQPA